MNPSVERSGDQELGSQRCGGRNGVSSGIGVEKPLEVEVVNSHLFAKTPGDVEMAGIESIKRLRAQTGTGGVSMGGEKV